MPMPLPIIFSGPSITHQEIEYATSAAAVGWNLNGEGYCRALEQRMAAFIGQRHAIALASGGSALQMAMLALRLKSGDEVLVPEIAPMPVAASIVHAGATPVFCDVDPQTLCLDPASAKARITPRTKGIVAVHVCGQPCDMVGIMKLTVKHKLFLVEDATQAAGAIFRGRKAGSFGNFTVFGLNGENTLTAGQGGLLLTSDQRLYETALRLAGDGAGANPFLYEALSFDVPMSNLQAAVALAQVERADELAAKKREIFGWYASRLQENSNLKLAPEQPECVSARFAPMLFLQETPKPRSEYIRELAALGIQTHPVWYPLSSMPMFERADNPVAYSLGVQALMLPCGHNRTEEEVEYICTVLKALVGGDAQKAAQVKPTGWMQLREETLERFDAAKQKGLTLPFEHDGKRYELRAMTEADVRDDAVISLLARLRRENSNIYLSRLPVRDQDVKSLLADYRTRTRDYLLFFLTGESGVIGHIGLDNFNFQKRECVVESLIMEQPVPRGLAAATGEALYAWAKNTLRITRIYNHVVGTNKKVRLLAAAQGFTELYTVPLRKQEVEGGVVFRPLYMPGHETPDEFFVISARNL